MEQNVRNRFFWIKNHPKESKLYFGIILCLLLMFSTVQSSNPIQNPNFSPINFLAPGWYDSKEVPPWVIMKCRIPLRRFQNQSMFISRWADEGFLKINSTLLRIFYIRDIYYHQQVEHEAGSFQFWGTLYNVDNQKPIYFKVEICGQLFMKQLGIQQIAPKTMLIAKYQVFLKKKCHLFIYQSARFSHQNKGVMVSNLKIIAIKRRIKRFSQRNGSWRKIQQKIRHFSQTTADRISHLGQTYGAENVGVNII